MYTCPSVTFNCKICVRDFACAVRRPGSGGWCSRDVRCKGSCSELALATQPHGAGEAAQPDRRKLWQPTRGLEAPGRLHESLDRGACDESDRFWRVQVAGGSVATAPAAVIDYAVRDVVRVRGKKSYRSSRELARLHRRFRSHGHPRRSCITVAKNWAWVLVNLPRAVVSPRFRSRHFPAAAQPLGRLAGSVRYRTVYL